MNTRIYIAVLLLGCWMGNTAFAQMVNRIGFMPSIDLVWKPNAAWKLAGEVETRHFILQEREGENVPFEYEYVHTDLKFLASRNVGLDARIAFGSTVRVRPDENAYRSIFQYIWLTRWNGLRLAHRLATDQTFSASEATEIRLRYRLGLEIPLNGQRLDARELYLKMNGETLGEWQGPNFNLEFRFVPTLGYAIARAQKLELGLDNRFDSFLDGGSRLTNYVTLNWYIRIGNN